VLTNGQASKAKNTTDFIHPLRRVLIVCWVHTEPRPKHHKDFTASTKGEQVLKCSAKLQRQSPTPSPPPTLSPAWLPRPQAPICSFYFKRDPLLVGSHSAVFAGFFFSSSPPYLTKQVYFSKRVTSPSPTLHHPLSPPLRIFFGHSGFELSYFPVSVFILW
jgi:hypothetical protein